MENQYSAENIQVIPLDISIRKRPAMFVGQMNTNGFVNILKGIIQDFFFLLEFNVVFIELANTNSVKIKIEGIKREIDKDLIYYQSAKQNEERIGKLFLLELQVLKALSADSMICSKDFEQVYKYGKLIKDTKEVKNISSSTLEFEFILDKQIWADDFEFNVNYIHQQIRDFAFLNKEIKFKLNYLVDNEENKSIFYFKNGLKDKVDIEILKGHGGSHFQMDIEMKTENFELQTAFSFRGYSVDEPVSKSYVNKAYTSENGTHFEALLKGITYGVMAYLQKHNLTGNHRISEKGMCENIIAFINIDMKTANFTGCVKNKLDNVEIIEPITKHISNLVFEKMESNKEAAKMVIDKFRID